MFTLFSANLLSRVYISLITIIISVLTARLLGPEGRGNLAIFINVINFMSMLLCISIGDSVFHPSLTNRSNNRLFTDSFIIVTGLLCISFVPVYFYLKTSSGVSNVILPLFVTTVISFQIIEGIIRSLATRANLLIYHNIYSVIGKTISLVCVVVAIYTYRSAIGVIISILFGLSISNGLSVFKFKLRIIRGVSVISCLEMIKVSLPIHIGLIGAAVLSQADQIIIGLYSSKSTIAHYQIAMQFISLPLLIPQAATNVIYNRLPEMGMQQREMFARKCLLFSLSFSLIIVFLIHFLSEPLIIILFGGEYLPASKFLNSASWIIFGTVSMTIMGPFWVVLGKAKKNSIFTLITACIFVVTSLYIFQKTGVNGVIGVLVFCYTGLAFLNIFTWLANRKMPETRSII